MDKKQINACTDRIELYERAKVVEIKLANLTLEHHRLTRRLRDLRADSMGQMSITDLREYNAEK